ncbi:phage baseplate assembly protein V [Paracoccus marinaquae]|uniref:Rhs element Vgr protein n=1 Tax=Paracoccus marinaquae TaxID=2841926 RepID=A0ABS6AHP4_9RHOB|nr:phage baseplate assembly protein V [Paracoccus marinaquae]MBU3030119.1 Rhs element Vgr protein [Paracoccus marinaquae]
MPASPLENCDGVLGVTIKLDGAPISSETQVALVDVRKAVGTIPEARVEVPVFEMLADDAAELDGNSISLGAQITIAAFYGDGAEQELFSGVIMAVRLRVDGRSGPRLELTCRDKAMALLELRNSLAYVDQKDSDAMSAVIGDAGLEADVEASTGDALTQLRFAVSDWDFLNILADRNGQMVIVDGGKISIRAPDTSAAAPLKITFGLDVIELDVSVDAQRAIGAAEISAWDSQQQQALTGSGGALPAISLGNKTSDAIAEVLGARTRRTSTAGEFASADLERMAKARLARSALAAVHGSCLFQGSGAIAPGDMLEIGGVGAMFSGTGYVSGVQHHISDGNWTTETRLGLSPSWATDRSGADAPAAAGITAPHMGLQIGKVLTIAEDPDGKQRIKVKLPMIGDPAAEIWARYGQPYASGSAGIQFMPETDDEVVVGFLSADPNSAIVLGSLHNGQATQAIAPEAENKLKGIITRENLRVDFDDDKKILKLSTPGGHAITMDDDAKELKLEDMNGNSITFSTSGIAMASDKDISITATGKVDVTATQDATLKGMNVTCNGDTGFTGKGGATAELSAGGQTTVKGAMVMIN